jgi:competence protein CoiA
MLCATRQSDAAKVTASETTKAQGPFVCPECAKTVILRKCRTKVDHFAHLPPVTCQYGAGETEQHRQCKTKIFEALRACPHVTKLELERRLGEVRPDISCYIDRIPVAIEVQISALSYDLILKRTEAYARKKIYLLWLSPWTDDLEFKERYAPKLWERWCHAAYYGRVYFWFNDSRVAPYHFDPYLLHVPHSEWRSEDGEEMSSGGYDRFSKKFKTPARGRLLDIATDFVPVDHPGFVGGSMIVPPCRLFKDRFGKFDELRFAPVPAVAKPASDEYDDDANASD